jgi:hypothetical protein
MVRGRVMLEDVRDSAERCLTETGLLTSDRAGRSPARVAAKTAAVTVRPSPAAVFPGRRADRGPITAWSR